MSETALEIVSAALQLPEADRLIIVSQLLEAMGDEEHLLSIGEDDFVAEMQRRRSDPSGTVLWSQLQDEN